MSADQNGPARPVLQTIADIMWPKPGPGGFRKKAYTEYAPYAGEYFRRCGEHLHLITEGYQEDILTAEDIRALVRAWRSRSDRPMAVIVDPLDAVCLGMGITDILAVKRKSGKLCRLPDG